MIGKKKDSEKGFALPLALLLLVVMSLMGSILISKTTTEHSANTTKDLSQQSFYAAESGITAAKNWMISETGQDLLKTSDPSNIDRDLRFCNYYFFQEYQIIHFNLKKVNPGGINLWDFFIISTWNKSSFFHL